MKLSVEGPSGAAQAYAYTGGKPFDAALPCVVFIHGALHDHSVWTLLARWCAHHGHSVLALDLPGHGRSAGPVLGSVEALGDWVLAALDAAGVAASVPVTLVGHSMGALIALEAAARSAERLRRLVMVGAAYPMKVSALLLTTARDAPLKAIDMVNAFSIGTLAAKPSFPGPGMWLHGSNQALMQRVLAGPNASGCAVNLFHHDFSVCDQYSNGLVAAAAVAAEVPAAVAAEVMADKRCPVTLVLGALDQMTPPRSSRDIAAVLGARVVMLPSGHSLMSEVPDGLLAALREALA